MPKFTIYISIVLLIAALILLFSKLFTPQPIQITLQSGQEVTTSTPEYFTITEVLLMIVSAFIIGAAATYLFYNSNGKDAKIKQESQGPKPNDLFEKIIPLLKSDEKSIIKTLIENNGELQQNKLAAKLGISKVKATRILYRLEQKNLITKSRHGLTNMIRLKNS